MTSETKDQPWPDYGFDHWFRQSESRLSLAARAADILIQLGWAFLLFGVGTAAIAWLWRH